VLTVKTTLWEAGFGAALRAFNGVSVVEMTSPYVSMPGESGTVPSLAVVARRREPQ
jgi:hypothetical protein